MGNVMVIGGTGFLGHHIVNMLVHHYQTESISVIDLRTSRNQRPDSDSVRYLEADITDASRLLSIFDETCPDVVIHTASPPPQATVATTREMFKKVNIDGTRCVVETCQKKNIKALVYTSSASIVSDNKSDLINIDERWPVISGAKQPEYYVETKAKAEELILSANRQGPHKLLTAAIRPSGIVGEGDTMVTYHIMNIYREGKTGVQVGKNDNLFDFTYVENVAYAHLLAAKALLLTAESGNVPLDHDRVDGEAFFITNDSPIYFWDFARAIWAAAGSPHGTEHVWILPRDVGLVLGLLSEVFFAIIRKPPTFNRQRIVYSCMTRYYNISKAKKRLGYKPLVSLDEGVRRTVKWFLAQEKNEGAMAR